MTTPKGVADSNVRDQGDTSFFDSVDGLTVWQGLARTAERLPGKTAVVAGDQRFTFAQLLERAETLAARLADLGLAKGEMAAVYMKNSIELVTAFYALQRLGVVVAWLNPDYREQEVRFILGNSGARTVFCLEEWEGFRHLDVVRSLREELPELERIVAVPASSESKLPEGVISFEALVSGVACLPASAAGEVAPDDLSMLLYTSGTTGQPKGAMIKQSQVLRAGLAYSFGVDATEEDIFIAFLSLSHSYGCGALLVQPFLLGSTVVIMDRFSAEKAFELIQRERVTIQLGSPAHYILELRNEKRKDYDLSSVRAGQIAGQIAPLGLISRVEEEMGIYISSFLGASEVGPGLSIILPYGSPLDVREQYIGYAFQGTQVKVIDPATGDEMPPGQPGELLLSGWHVMQGYWKNPEATAHQIRDGWLHTGDMVLEEANGLVKILGRLKECINRGGFKIIPSELERLLLEHPEVEEVCVVGTPNPVLGESICVCVIPGPDAALKLEGLRIFLKGKLADNKLPDELLVLEQFPRLSGGLKVNRFGKGGVLELASNSPDKQTLR